MKKMEVSDSGSGSSSSRRRTSSGIRRRSRSTCSSIVACYRFGYAFSFLGEYFGCTFECVMVD